MKKLNRISIFFFLLVAIGCSSQIETPISFPATAAIENTETPKPTSTPTISPSPPPEQVTIEFPEWVKNPETQIFFAPIGTFKNGIEGIFLFNAETKEKFNIPFISTIGDYFWVPDGSGFGFLPAGKTEVMFFSIKEETITTIFLPKTALRYFQRSYEGSPPDPIQASVSTINDPNFLIIPSWLQISPNRNFFVYQETYDDTYTSVFDIKKEKLVVISDPEDEYYDLFSGFSPDSKYIAISQADEESGNYYSFEVSPTIRLRIYDLQTQQLINSYKNVTFPKWSPDGTKFLYQEWEDNLNGWIWYGESPPCIFDTLSNSTHCYNETYHKTSSNIRVDFSSVQWAPDQSMFGYIYSIGGQGGFCTVTLLSGDTRCMLENLESENTIIKYIWSPDSRFISFEFDTSCPYCDESFTPQLAIANVQTGEYFTLGGNMNLINLGVWRPLPDR